MALEPIHWELLGNLGKNLVDSYKAGREIGLDNDRRAALGALGPNASLQDIARVNLQSGDNAGALSALGLAQRGSENEASQRLDLLRIATAREQARASQAQAQAQLGQQEASSGIRMRGGTVENTPGALQAREAIKAIDVANRETPAEDKRAIFQSEELIKSRKRALEALNEAESLNDKAFSGGLASERGAIAANSPLPNVAPFPDSERGLATLRLDNLLQKQALGHLKETFGGQPSNKEGALQVQLEGARNLPAATRLQIIRDAKQAVQDTIDLHTDRLKQLRAGTYFDEQGKKAAGTAAKPSAAVRFRQLTAGGASKEDAFKAMAEEGY